MPKDKNLQQILQEKVEFETMPEPAALTPRDFRFSKKIDFHIGGSVWAILGGIFILSAAIVGVSYARITSQAADVTFAPVHHVPNNKPINNNQETKVVTPPPPAQTIPAPVAPVAEDWKTLAGCTSASGNPEFSINVPGSVEIDRDAVSVACLKSGKPGGNLIVPSKDATIFPMIQLSADTKHLYYLKSSEDNMSYTLHAADLVNKKVNTLDTYKLTRAWIAAGPADGAAFAINMISGKYFAYNWFVRTPDKSIDKDGEITQVLVGRVKDIADKTVFAPGCLLDPFNLTLSPDKNHILKVCGSKVYLGDFQTTGTVQFPDTVSNPSHIAFNSSTTLRFQTTTKVSNGCITDIYTSDFSGGNVTYVGSNENCY